MLNLPRFSEDGTIRVIDRSVCTSIRSVAPMLAVAVMTACATLPTPPDQTLSLEAPGAHPPAERQAFFCLFEAGGACAVPLHVEPGNAARIHVGRGTTRSLEERDGTSLNLQLADAWMSSVHAELVRAGGSWIVKDSDSKNGVWVNGQRTRSAVLRDGDFIEFGHSLFLYRSTRTPAVQAEVQGWPTAALTPHFVTSSPHLGAEFVRVRSVAASNVSVLITGPTGTGKELVARAVHQLSGRKGPFVAVNCGAIAPNLLEAELFGYRRGAFSGALEDRPGLIRSASGGTLFLDEVGELSSAAQTSLLRVLQEREVLPVGGTTAVSVDVRFVSATCRNLEEMVSASAFRRDLFARLYGFTARLIPLKDRREDLAHLLPSLLTRTGAPEKRFSPAAMRALVRYDWPMNVRELDQCLTSAALMAESSDIELVHLPEHLRAERTGSTAVAMTSEPEAPLRGATLSSEDQALRERVQAALTRNSSNISAAARDLQTSRLQIRRWMKRFGLEKNE